jgi:hypothetical protein
MAAVQARSIRSDKAITKTMFGRRDYCGNAPAKPLSRRYDAALR